VTSSAPPAAASVDSPLAALIQELAGGADMQRWCAAQLREALEQDLSGQVEQALATLQTVMTQLSDPRIRVERDRLQAKSLRASSGVYRARALRAESAARHEEAAESWRKVLEACPDDAEAALHAAMCCMESGNIRQAGVHARRAVELAPNSISAHKLMLRFFRKTGMQRNADREREILRKLAKG
jgi:tetratricopeptide (TPR) repeat protein